MKNSKPRNFEDVNFLIGKNDCLSNEFDAKKIWEFFREMNLFVKF